MGVAAAGVIALDGGVKTIRLRSRLSSRREAVVAAVEASGAFEAGGVEEMGVESMGSTFEAVGLLDAGGVEGEASGPLLRLLEGPSDGSA